MAPSLILKPYNTTPFRAPLQEDTPLTDPEQELYQIDPHAPGIFSNLSYELYLQCDELSEVQTVDVYINDFWEPTKFFNDSGRILFSPKESKRIFNDCYGYVVLHLTLKKTDSTELHLRTGYFPVLVQHGKLNESVNCMVSYVQEHFPELLLNGVPKSRSPADLKESHYQTLSSQILLLQRIASVYESSYSFFKVNCRSRIEKIPTIVPLERLQMVTSATLQFIASHPEQLHSTDCSNGIRIQRQCYQPRKVLSLQNIPSFNLYENRIILGFLLKMVDISYNLIQECDKLLQQIPSSEDYNQQYVYSPFYLAASTRRSLEDGKMQLTSLHQKFVKMWNLYHDAIPISVSTVQSEPRPSAIFLSVPQYNQIFLLIHQWFQSGIYDLDSEKYLLSFLQISALYECYLLVKTYQHLKRNGFNCISSEQFSYNVSSTAKYKNTTCKNTFCFQRGFLQLTLYFQPVIFNNGRCENGIELYRNNSIKPDRETQGASYYTPDYILKVESNNKSRYLILDAKFSNRDDVRAYCVEDLAFKYLFSLSPVSSSSSITGLCILYGKCTEGDSVKSAYDNQLPGHRIFPCAELIPLMEGISSKSESESSKFDFIFKLLLDSFG